VKQMKKWTISIIGLAVALPLLGCAGNENTGMDDSEPVASANSALTYGHYWNVKKMENGIYTAIYNQEATNRLVSWDMPLAIDEYCEDHRDFSSCIPSAAEPRPAWVRVLTNSAGWSGWIRISDWSQMSTLYNTNSVAKGCRRLDLAGGPNNNWYCYAGAGGPGWSYGVSAYYGQGSS